MVLNYPANIFVFMLKIFDKRRQKPYLCINFKTMIEIDIDQAIAYAYMQKKMKLKKSDIAAVMWPDSTEAVRKSLMSNLVTGKTKKISLDWIENIIQLTGIPLGELLIHRD